MYIMAITTSLMLPVHKHFIIFMSRTQNCFSPSFLSVLNKCLWIIFTLHQSYSRKNKQMNKRVPLSHTLTHTHTHLSFIQTLTSHLKQNSHMWWSGQTEFWNQFWKFFLNRTKFHFSTSSEILAFWNVDRFPFVSGIGRRTRWKVFVKENTNKSHMETRIIHTPKKKPTKKPWYKTYETQQLLYSETQRTWNLKRVTNERNTKQVWVIWAMWLGHVMR